MTNAIDLCDYTHSRLCLQTPFADAYMTLLLVRDNDVVRSRLLGLLLTADDNSRLFNRFITISGMRERLAGRASIHAAIAGHVRPSLIRQLLAVSPIPAISDDPGVVAYLRIYQPPSSTAHTFLGLSRQ